MRQIRALGFAGLRGRYWVGIVLMVLASLVTALQPALVGQIAQAYLSTENVPSLLVGALVVAFAVDAVGSTGSRLLLGWSSERFVRNLRAGLAERILGARAADFQRFDRGDLGNRIVEDIPIVQRPYFSTYPDMVGAGLVAVLCFGGMLLTSWRLTLALVGVLVVAAALLTLVLRNLNTAAARSREVEASFSSFLYEVLYNAVPVKALRAEQWVGGRLAERAEQARGRGNRVVGYNALILPVVNIGTQVGLVGVLLGGGLMVAQGTLQAAQLAAYFLYLVYLISPLVSLALALGELRQADASWARLVDLFEGLPPELEPDGAAAISPFTGPARLEAIGLVHTYGADAEGTVVRMGDVRIEGPGVHCLVGANGVGKSTLLSLASGLHTPTGGTLAWNGSPVTPQNALTIRREVHLLPQHRDTLSLSVRDNILMGSTYSDTEILSLADRLGASAFFAGLPAGLDTLVGAEGTGLSGGQKQLLFVMHALLIGPPVLLLDEFAANLDGPTKERVAHELAELGRTRLVLLIAHDEYLLRRFPSHVRLGAESVTPDGEAA